MYVIGTAGHVDHGKSTLIKALTGINPDRLAEEQERQMTIDLGFAWHTLPSGEEIGIVDVPGHRDFIENMLAGVGGIDLVLFVVAADEGIMPQSREHLNIVKLLGIQHGLIALTKIDLVSDPDWLTLVQADIRDLVKGTFMQNVPIIPVSAIKDQGMNDLSNAIDAILPNIQKESGGSTPRLPIDRVFSLRGFGTIVTGTLVDGGFTVGEQVEILPSGLQTRIRGIQTHKKKQQNAEPGNRTAVNLTGVEVDDIVRGDVLCRPKSLSPTNMIDVEIHVLADFPDHLTHDDEVKVFLGTSQTMARARVIGENDISSGQRGFLQLMLSGQVVAKEGDRLILRRPSPPATIGGGIVINAFPRKRYKRFSDEVLEKLEVHASGTQSDRVFLAIQDSGISDLAGISEKVQLDNSKLLDLIDEFLVQGKLVYLSDPIDEQKRWFITSDYWKHLHGVVQVEMEKFHQANALQIGAPQIMLQNLLHIDKRPAQAVINGLIDDGLIIQEEGLLRLTSFKITFTKEQTRMVNDLIQDFKNAELQTPAVKEVIEKIGDDLYQYLINSGILKTVSPSVVFLSEQVDAIVQKTEDFLAEKSRITVADFRDHLSTSRKYAVALLEYMDEHKITRREGDYRIKYAG